MAFAVAARPVGLSRTAAARVSVPRRGVLVIRAAKGGEEGGKVGAMRGGGRGSGGLGAGAMGAATPPSQPTRQPARPALPPARAAATKWAAAAGGGRRSAGADASARAAARALTRRPTTTPRPPAPLQTWDKSVYGRVGASGNFNLLANSIAKCGLEAELTGEGPFTLFAPDDDAFGDALKSLGVNKVCACVPASSCLRCSSHTRACVSPAHPPSLAVRLVPHPTPSPLDPPPHR